MQFGRKLFEVVLISLLLLCLMGIGGGIFQLWRMPPINNQVVNAASHRVITDNYFVVNHLSIEQFHYIPDHYIEAAVELDLLFRHASVGANIDDGLNCLMDAYDPRPNRCDRDLDPDEIFYDEKYDRSNWDFEFHSPPPNPNPGWWNKVNYFIGRVNNLEPGQYEVAAFKFGYVDGHENSNIASHFFNPDSSMPNTSDLEALEAEHPDKIVVWWTMGLARAIGTQVSEEFNNQLRAYAAANGKPLMDIAAIVSHTPDGQPCFHNGYAAMCADYTTEQFGGHLNARGKLRMAKAYWVLMARLAGWRPGDDPPPPTPQPTPTPDPRLTEKSYLPFIAKP